MVYVNVATGNCKKWIQFSLITKFIFKFLFCWNSQPFHQVWWSSSKVNPTPL
jgi:hypothetical protein